MRCNHERKKFITFMDFRGYPEKLFICEECGITISDFITAEDNQSYIKSNEYVPSINLGVNIPMVETTLSL